MERLQKLYKEWRGSESSECTLLAASGSARRYYRMDGGVIGCIGTSAVENRAFFAVDKAVLGCGLHAPKVYAVSEDDMVYLQEDLGEGQLYAMLVKDGLSDGNMALLKRTMQLLPVLQVGVGKQLDWSVCFPDRELNARMVDFDLNYFKYDFLKFTGIEFSEIRLQDCFDALKADALDYAGDTFMYRDFQARNVMVSGGEPCFIDFQGGRRGPGEYDLASFLWNAGTHFSADVRHALELEYLSALKTVTEVDEEAFWKRYHTMIFLRLLQETGAYGFRGIIERKPHFLECIPLVLKSFLELPNTYPYLCDVLRRLATEWDGTTNLPGLKIQL